MKKFMGYLNCYEKNIFKKKTTKYYLKAKLFWFYELFVRFLFIYFSFLFDTLAINKN